MNGPSTHPIAGSSSARMLEGAVAILFGLLFLFAPVPTIVAAVFLFAAFALADGVIALVSIFSKSRTTSGWLLALYGLVGIAIGIIAFAWPGATIVVLLTLLAIWAFVVGILRIAAAIAMRRETEGEGLQIVTGIVSILFGFYVLFVPGGLRALVVAIGIFALIIGILLLISGARMRDKAEAQWRGRGGAGPAEPRAAAD